MMLSSSACKGSTVSVAACEGGDFGTTVLLRPSIVLFVALCSLPISVVPFAAMAAILSSSSPLVFASLTTSNRFFGTGACTHVMIRALLAKLSKSSCNRDPASAFSALSGFGCMSKQVMVTKTSRSVSVDSQSLFNVSTHTAPVPASTFGCQILVWKEAVGGDCG